MSPPEFSVIIPTLNASRRLPELIARLRRQTERNVEIIVIDSASADGTAAAARSLECIVIPIARSAFDHAETRNLAARRARGEILVFMTQDALPATDDFLERLAAPLKGGRASAAYARQIPYPDARPTESFARAYNYPPASETRHPDRVPARCLRTLFFSNVASAVSRDCFHELGGFGAPALTHEDMLFCAALLNSGHPVAYAADAVVYHSHALSPAAIFRRYFGAGVMVREHRAVLRCGAESGEGRHFAVAQLRHLLRTRAYGSVPRSAVEILAKFIGYECGLRHRYFSRRLKRLLSGNAGYWDRQAEAM